jgi:hypothetical protein
MVHRSPAALRSQARKVGEQRRRTSRPPQSRLRYELGGKVYGRENHTFRDAGRTVSGLAGANVVPETARPPVTLVVGRGAHRGGSARLTLVVLGGLGLDVSGETVPYVAGWGEDGALDAVTQFAQLIDDLARRVEAALSTAGDTQETAATG